MAVIVIALVVFLVVIAALLLAIKLHFKPTFWHADGQVMIGKTVIVTGANTGLCYSLGIGLETAYELARYGARVIMACRNMQKANEAKATIMARCGSDLDSRLIVQQLDLSSFKSIRSFADNILKTEKRLDVLINNAGCDFAEKKFTEDGLEMTVATNHFGPFLLTNLLLGLLEKSAPSRIVVVASEMHFLGKIDFENINGEKSYRMLLLGLTTAYCNSKLANILFAKHLAKQLESKNVTVTCLHPGVVTTELFRNSDKWFQRFFTVIKSFLLKTPFEGAQTSIYLAASKSPDALVNGGYYDNCKLGPLSKAARDAALGKKLWEFSEKVTGLDSPLAK